MAFSKPKVMTRNHMNWGMHFYKRLQILLQERGGEIGSAHPRQCSSDAKPCGRPDPICQPARENFRSCSPPKPSSPKCRTRKRLLRCRAAAAWAEWTNKRRLTTKNYSSRTRKGPAALSGYASDGVRLGYLALDYRVD